jgi:hypothetical protein
MKSIREAKRFASLIEKMDGKNLGACQQLLGSRLAFGTNGPLAPPWQSEI